MFYSAFSSQQNSEECKTKEQIFSESVFLPVLQKFKLFLKKFVILTL